MKHSNGNGAEYGDTTALMGDGDAGFSAASRYSVHWLPESSTTLVTASDDPAAINLQVLGNDYGSSGYTSAIA